MCTNAVSNNDDDKT
ncbi:unnamed protein product, partial [Rotaria magnacalcarata]